MIVKKIPILSERQQLNEIAASYSNGSHSLFGPSSAHMWAVCAGSLIPNVLSTDPGNLYAATGTIAHWVSEIWLRTGKKPKNLIGTKHFVGDFDVEITHEMMDYVQSSVDRCMWLPGRHLIEQHLFFGTGLDLMPIARQGGTMDFAALVPGHGKLVDHKYGIADQIFAKNNFQLMLYALLVWLEWDWMYDFKSFTIFVHQPRLNHFDEWNVSVNELMQFAGWIRERARQAWRLNAPRTPDPHACRYCKVRSTCAANLKMQFALSNGDLDDAFHEQTVDDLTSFLRSIDDEFGPFRPPLGHIPTLDTYHLSVITPYRTMVEAWWNAASAELLKRGLSGEGIGNQKIVLSSKNRVWKSEAAASAFLIDQGVPQYAATQIKSASPAEAVRQLVKLGKTKEEAAELLAKFIERPPGEPTLAPLSDRRQELVIAPASAWRDESSTTETEEY